MVSYSIYKSYGIEKHDGLSKEEIHLIETETPTTYIDQILLDNNIIKN